MVDITPSLKAGKMGGLMGKSLCNGYCIKTADPDKKNKPHYYISRNAPGNINRNESNEVMGIYTKKKQYSEGFSYKSKVFMHHYFVQNPEVAGAVGIIIIPNGEYRTLIASGPLTGCGFAVLIWGGNIFVIHAGGSNDKKEELTAERRRMMINRDIFLMANALIDSDNYSNFFRDSDQNYRDNGMTCEELFCKLQQQDFKGFIYVNKDNSQLICDKTDANLAIWSYHENCLYDVVCVINEEGNMSSTIRKIELIEKKYDVTGITQNELYKRKSDS